jgi:hypothetical protein
MITEFIAQIAQIIRWFEALFRITPFAPGTPASAYINYWVLYFTHMSGQITELRAQQGVLVSRLRDVKRKQSHVIAFLKTYAQSFVDPEPPIKQLTIFFTNCGAVLSAIMEPHVAPSDTARFAQTLNPLIHAAQKALARSTSRKPEVSQKISQMQKIVSTAVGKINTGNASAQQTFADNLYDAADDFLKVAGDDIVLRGATDAVLVLQSAVAEYTTKAQHTASVRGIASCIPPENIKAIIKKYPSRDFDETWDILIDH